MPLIDLDAQVAQVLAVIRQAGGRPMLAGGCVRDALIAPGTPAKDIDIEVYGLPFGTLSEALAATEKVTEAGKSFGVLKVRAGAVELDISVPRRDSKTGAGHRGFSVAEDPGMSFAEASSRRDYTVNSLMYDPATGELTDCHGGRIDLAAGILRHTSAAFSEDPLRVLRGVQFAARFGFRMAPETAVLCRSLVDSCAELATERIWGEWEKIGTRGTGITAALDVLEATGWDVYFYPLPALRGLAQDPEWHPEGDVWVHSGLAATQAARLADDAGLSGPDRFVIVMAALLHDIGKVTHTQMCGGRITSHGHAAAGVAPANVLLYGIGCPPAIIARILPLIREHMCCTGKPTGSAVRRLARRLPPSSLAELALVVGGDRAGRGDPSAPNPAAAWLDKAKDLKVTERPAKGLLTGDHLIAAGMAPGPAFKPILADALIAQDAGEFDDEPGARVWLGGYMEAT